MWSVDQKQSEGDDFRVSVLSSSRMELPLMEDYGLNALCSRAVVGGESGAELPT